MRKLTLKIFFILIFLLSLTNFNLVYGIIYNSLDISVICEKNGTAHIREVWDLEVDTGTEMFLERKNNKEESILNFEVSSDNIKYKNVENYESWLHLKDKSYKYCIEKNGFNYKFCWGLPNYGEICFDVRYDLTNLVKGSPEGSYIDRIFVNSVNQNIKKINIKIEQKNQKFKDENTKIWAGGGAVGEINLVDGIIQARTIQDFSPGMNFGILAQFTKDVFTPDFFVNITFEELKNKELKGTNYNSKYYEKKSIFKVILSYLPTLFIFLIIFKFFRGRKNKNNINDLGNINHYEDKFMKEYRNANYSREIPFNNNLFATYACLKNLNSLGNKYLIVGAYLLKWIHNNKVDLIEYEYKKFFKKKKEVAIKFKSLDDNNLHHLEKRLFEIFKSAADNDNLLYSKVFSKFCKNNFYVFVSWFKEYEYEGFKDLKEMGAVVQKKEKFLWLFNYTKNEISDFGVKQTTNMFGFKKYLEDFTIINEREAKEIELWGDYLVYAQIFGIADKVSEQFKNLYPKYFEDKFLSNSRDSNFVEYVVINNLVNSYMGYVHSAGRSYSEKLSSSGKGGFFSGGGFNDSSGKGSSGVR